MARLRCYHGHRLRIVLLLTSSREALHVAGTPDRLSSGFAPGEAEGVADLLARAAAAGLPLSEDEARGLLTSVRRLDAMGDEVRALIDPAVEPAGPAVAPWRTPRS